MVNFQLQITGEFENITSLQPQGGCDSLDFRYFFKLQCGNCQEVTQKHTCVSLSETVPVPNGRGTTNLAQRCKFCGRDGTVLMIPGRGKPLSLDITSSSREKFAPLMIFDCRGFEPVDFFFGSGWEAVSASGTKFTDIDLSEGEFTEYDEEGKYPVQISDLTANFIVVK
ncbi:hypothetical protein MRB53_006718 [Persea americana]|uniref:Uncharacterized protein n=1 Tax=Persea americana TaxID=3435 RepID=A0ACC2MH34_PERAE|nr:hypothetical protein MRB53_006718 [Persea americana]|eukprot:TRINITY_DN1342_c0_g1_i1.p1 TRINITY_DN1342_c0_g1~~TRINITY_DN1342_c0_g1_i1.p1  ORF type:complete len:169 (-),score=28.15 TRINITY_DN1342_c0_g1_i1:515-1021(-)